MANYDISKEKKKWEGGESCLNPRDSKMVCLHLDRVGSTLPERQRLNTDGVSVQNACACKSLFKVRHYSLG